MSIPIAKGPASPAWRYVSLKLAVGMSGLLALSGCAEPAAPGPEAPPLGAAQALDLIRRWLTTLSPEASVTAEDLVSSPNSRSVLARLTVNGVRFRDPLAHGYVEYSGMAEADFKLFKQGTWALTRLTIDPGGKSTRTWDGLHITADYKADLSAAQQQNDIPKNEEIAIARVRALLTAEALYASTNGNQCGSLRELVQAHLIDREYTAETVGGYRFSVAESEGVCRVLATPRVLGLTGQRSFYAPLTDSQIRYSSDRSIPTAAFPKLR